MGELKLDASHEKVAFILDNIPETRSNQNLLLISYWQLFDGVDIPQSVVKQIAELATPPGTVSRSKRRAKELARYKEIMELQRLAQAKELEEVE